MNGTKCFGTGPAGFAESLLFGPVAVIVIALTKHNEVVFLILGVLILRPLTEWAVYWWLGRKY